MPLHTRAGSQATLLALAFTPCALSRAAPPEVPQAQTVPLRYARPWDILKVMHWEERTSVFPAGVRTIRAQAEGNALRVEGTPQGIAQVREITRTLDTKPRFVQVRLQFIRATRRAVDAYGINFDLVPFPSSGESRLKGFKQIGSGSVVAGLLDTLTRGKPDGGATSILITSNNAPITETSHGLFRSPEPAALGDEKFPVIADTRTLVSPRINSDETITLDLKPDVSIAGPENVTTQTLSVLRTVRSGETMVLGGFACDADTVLLLFVTPTLLPDEGTGGAD